MKRPSARHKEKESKLEISIKSFPLELRELGGRGCRKIVGIKWDGSYQKNGLLSQII